MRVTGKVLNQRLPTKQVPDSHIYHIKGTFVWIPIRIQTQFGSISLSIPPSNKARQKQAERMDKMRNQVIHIHLDFQ